MRNRVVCASIAMVLLLSNVGLASESQSVKFNADGTSVLYDNKTGEVVNTGTVDFEVINKSEEELRANSGQETESSEKSTGESEENKEGNETETETETEKSPVGKYRVKTDLNIRKGPSVDTERVDIISEGTVIEVLDTTGEFWKIDNGYVSKNYLELVESYETEATETESEVETESETEIEIESETESEVEKVAVDGSIGELKYRSFDKLRKLSYKKKAKGKSFEEKVELYKKELNRADVSYNDENIFVTVRAYGSENSNIYVSHVLVKDGVKFEKTSETSGVFAISTGYNEEYTSTGWIVDNGEVVRNNASVGKEIVYTEDGNFYSPSDGEQLPEENDVYNTMSSTDGALRVDGKTITTSEADLFYPRTCVGEVETGEYYFISYECKSRTPDVSLVELASIFENLDCDYVTALEGLSIRLYVDGKEITNHEGDMGTTSDMKYLSLKAKE